MGDFLVLQPRFTMHAFPSIFVAKDMSLNFFLPNIRIAGRLSFSVTRGEGFQSLKMGIISKELHLGVTK
jgi:hypothetical protein